MNRREFLQAGTAGLALSAFGAATPMFGASRAKRVGLIGTGWYGKSALLRLLQNGMVRFYAWVFAVGVTAFTVYLTFMD